MPKPPKSQQLRHLRRAQNLTQAEIGKLIGRDQPTIARYEQGRQKLSADEERRLARLLNAPVDGDE